MLMESYTNQEFYKEYEVFKEKYLNNTRLPIMEICKELGISKHRSSQFITRIKEETGYERYYGGAVTIVQPIQERKTLNEKDYMMMYEDFKEDYLNKGLTQKELVRKYNLPYNHYINMIHLVCDRTGGWMRKRGRHGYLVNKFTGDVKKMEDVMV